MITLEQIISEIAIIAKTYCEYDVVSGKPTFFRQNIVDREDTALIETTFIHNISKKKVTFSFGVTKEMLNHGPIEMIQRYLQERFVDELERAERRQ